MVLKQRFEQGRTQFIDIGNDWMLIQQNAVDFEMIKKEHFTGSDNLGNDVHAFILYGDRKQEPLYRDFPQWVYTNDGQLFLTLTETQTK